MVAGPTNQPLSPSVPATAERLCGSVSSIAAEPDATAGAFPQPSLAVRDQLYTPLGTSAPALSRRSQVMVVQSDVVGSVPVGSPARSAPANVGTPSRAPTSAAPGTTKPAGFVSLRG